ncbi:energy transducer TonB [Derxia lacustris]|uniref:energy transducer TonB n=1 Tax=Derxia lacustris TaxID=764842 RepID=UPI00111C0BAD|nr:energy transducer TonB [Derxia lacustris]
MNEIASGLRPPWRRGGPGPAARLRRPVVRFTFAQGLGVSLLLHGMLLSPWLLHRPTPEPASQRLTMELFGMVGTRQVAARTAASAAAPAEGAPPAPAASQQPRPAPAPRPAPTERPDPAARRDTPPDPRQWRTANDGPVAAPAPAAAPAAAASASASAAPPAPAAQAGAMSVEARAAETVKAQPEPDVGALRRYVAALTRAIQSRLVYPAEARRAGLVGTTAVRFVVTESGEIQPGSLAVHRGSGSALLDDNALRAAQASAPFDRPPRRMEVVLDVVFAEDR